MSQLSGEPGAAGSYGPPTSNFPPTRSYRGILGIILAVILILLIILVLFFFPRPTATVTLTPVSKTLSDSLTVSVPAHQVSSTQQGSQTGVPTGSPKPGTHATGLLTFQNATFSWVIIPAGTSVTNDTGQQVVTDTVLNVPPDPGIPGVASVLAHAVNIGSSGNIHAMSINKDCCFPGISVLNKSAFSGGLDSQTVNTVLQSDIDSAAHSLEPSLIQKAQKDIQTYLTSGEDLVNATPQCSPSVISNPGVGESAAKFTVTVSVTCSDSAYHPQAALSQATDRLKQQTAQQLGPNFILAGTIVTKVEKVTLGQNGDADVLVSAKGRWKYQFTSARKLDMAKHIARATVTNAKSWLLRQEGVTAVSISISGPILNLGRNNRIPDDLRAITING